MYRRLRVYILDSEYYTNQVAIVYLWEIIGHQVFGAPKNINPPLAGGNAISGVPST